MEGRVVGCYGVLGKGTVRGPHLVECGYLVSFVESDDVFSYGFHDAGDIVAGVCIREA